MANIKSLRRNKQAIPLTRRVKKKKKKQLRGRLDLTAKELKEKRKKDKRKKESEAILRSITTPIKNISAFVKERRRKSREERAVIREYERQIKAQEKRQLKGRLD